MPDAQKFGMRVAQLLDKTTIVVSGEGVEGLRAGQMLLILAIGQKLEGLAAPLVVPKAEVVVDAVTKYYAIAKTPEYETTVETGILAISAVGKKTVVRRDPLRVDEKQLVGNPAWGPVSVGDPVVQSGDLSDFVDQLAASQA